MNADAVPVKPMASEAGSPRTVGSLEGVRQSWKSLGFLVPLALLALAVAAPAVVGSYGQKIAATAFMYVALAQSWNLIGGYAGLMSLALPAFFGTGAIVAGVLVVNGVSAVLAVLSGVGLALAVALVIGGPTLRLQGHYFVIATLLITEALRNLILNINVAGFSGSTALNLFNATQLSELSSTQFNLFFYFLLLLIAVASMAVVMFVERSRMGYALRSIRDNERAAQALGVATARQKMLVFLISSGMAGLVGGVWAFWLGTVETNEAFGFRLSFEVIVMVFLGGRGTVWGPVAGAALIVAINETIGVDFPELHLVISGALVALVVLFLPDGLASALSEGPRAFKPRRLAANLYRYRVK